MSDNPKTYEVILLDHTEMRHDESGEYMSVFAIGGNNYKLNAKRQNLWGVFNKSSKGQIVLLTFETFVNDKKETITFLSNAEKGSFEKVWQAGLQGTLKRLLVASDEDRQRSQALSYAKDIYAAQISSMKNGILRDDIDELVIKLAKSFFAFIKGQPAEIEVAHIETPEEPIKTEENEAQK